MDKRSFRSVPCDPLSPLPCVSDALNSLLSDFEVLPWSGLQLHSVRKRDVHAQSHLERLVSFRALRRYSSTRAHSFSSLMRDRFTFFFFKSVLK